MSGPIGVRQERGRIPLLEDQVVELNLALTAEVLRHAETRVRLKAERAWRRFNEERDVEKEACR